MPVPRVEFTQTRLPNGLRLIVSEDHIAPVAAVNVWYNVGSKHEVKGKTGFAHLFEHVMFQGSANVGKTEHMALVQAAVFGIAALGLGLGWSSLLVGIVLMVAAAAFYYAGRDNAGESLAPTRTIDQIKRDISLAKEQL